MRTLIMMFVFFIAQTSFCLANTVDEEKSKEIITKGTLVGEWVADFRRDVSGVDPRILHKAYMHEDVFYICTMYLWAPFAVLECSDEHR